MLRDKRPRLRYFAGQVSFLSSNTQTERDKIMVADSFSGETTWLPMMLVIVFLCPFLLFVFLSVKLEKVCEAGEGSSAKYGAYHEEPSASHNKDKSELGCLMRNNNISITFCDKRPTPQNLNFAKSSSYQL